jgi:hypothetical protein
MKMNLLKGAAVLGVAAALSAGVPNAAVAAPFQAGHGEALKSSAPSDTIEVRRRHGRYWAYGLGGLALGAVLAAPYYRGYGPGYGYGYSAYGPGQKCWVQTGPYRGQGYWGWC